LLHQHYQLQHHQQQLQQQLQQHYQLQQQQYQLQFFPQQQQQQQQQHQQQHLQHPSSIITPDTLSVGGVQLETSQPQKVIRIPSSSTKSTRAPRPKSSGFSEMTRSDRLPEHSNVSH